MMDMMISQGFNIETGELATFVKNWKWAETNENIALYKFPDSDLDSDTSNKKNRSKKSKKREDSNKKRHTDSSPQNSSLYCILHG